MTDLPPSSGLTTDQEQRALALALAAPMIVRNGAGVGDLIRLANWILTGNDPTEPSLLGNPVGEYPELEPSRA